MLHLRHSATNDYVVIMFMMQQLGINLLELFLSFIPLIFLLFLLFVLLSLSLSLSLCARPLSCSLQYWFVVLGDLATCSNTMSVSSCAFAYLTAWDSFSTECWYNLSGALGLPAFTLLQTAMTLQRPRSSASLRTPAYTHTHTSTLCSTVWGEGSLGSQSLFRHYRPLRVVTGMATTFPKGIMTSQVAGAFLMFTIKPELICYLVLLISGRL